MAHRYDYPSGGKGDTRIPAQISEEEMARRWAQTFGQDAPSNPDRPHRDGLDSGDDGRSSPARYDRLDVAPEEGR